MSGGAGCGGAARARLTRAAVTQRCMLHRAATPHLPHRRIYATIVVGSVVGVAGVAGLGGFLAYLLSQALVR